MTHRLNDEPDFDVTHPYFTEPGDRPIRFAPDGDNGLGSGVLVRVRSESTASDWVGEFVEGDGMVSDLIVSEASASVYVIAKGNGYAVSLREPNRYSVIHCYPIEHMHLVPNRSILVFGDYTRLVAYDGLEMKWRTKRLSSDGIEIEAVSASKITGKVWEADKRRWASIEVDLTSGNILNGPASIHD